MYISTHVYMADGPIVCIGVSSPLKNTTHLFPAKPPICQFEFLVMIEKNIFVYKFFLSLNISDFSVFFYKKMGR